jgi:hypothetical protein
MVTREGKLLVFDSAGKPLATVPPPPGTPDIDPARLCLSPDGRIAYVRRPDLRTDRYDLCAGRWLDPLPPMPGADFIPHPDGRRILYVDPTGEVRRWDLAAGAELPPVGLRAPVSAAPSPDGRRVAIASGDGRLTLFDLRGQRVWSVPAPAGAIPR